MNFRALVLVSVAVTLVDIATAGLPIAGVINMGLRVILNNLKNNGNITHKGNVLVPIPASMNDLIVGSMILDNLTVYGTSGMKFTTGAKDIPSADPDFSKANVSFALSFDKIGLLTGYNVDIGIIDELPIYGEGQINLALTKVQVGVNVIVTVKSDFSKKNISDLKLQIALFDSPGYITGFWRNDQASKFLTGIINILEKFVCMFITYEKDCINCILGNIIEFAINIYLGLTERKLLLNCECLKDDTYKFRELLENIGNSYVNEGIEGIEKYLTSEEVLKILSYYYRHLSDVECHTDRLKMGQKLHDDFLKLFCEKNSDGTQHLRLKGRELFQRIGTRLEAEDMYKVSSFLCDNPKIISLNLCFNNIGDEGLTILSENYFNKDNGLVHINLMCCDIQAEGMKSFSSSEFLKLKSCRINGNKIGAEGARYIASLIENCPSLENIDIAETDQTLESIESILIVIEESTLRSLDISRIIPATYYTKFNTATLADDIAIVLRLNSTLVELHIQKCHIDGHDIELLLSGLEGNKTLEMLDLACNRVCDLGVEYLAQWLKSRPALRALNLSANNIRNFGARALSFGLPFSKVRFLDISYNHIEDLGLTDLLDTIKKYCRMRILFIWGNNLGTAACQRLDRMLKSQILEQEYLDVKIYEVDGELHAAYYPSNHYKHKYYSVMDHGCRVELKIKRNEIPHPSALPRELLNFTHIGRYPPVDKRLGLLQKKVKECD